MVAADYYRVLGIPENSSIDEIKKAYRKKARLYHPDINNSPDSNDRFIEATEAYDFLIAHYGKNFSEEIEDGKKVHKFLRFFGFRK